MDIFFSLYSPIESKWNDLWSWLSPTHMDWVNLGLALFALVVPVVSTMYLMPQIRTSFSMRNDHGIDKLLFNICNVPVCRFSSMLGIRRMQVDALRVNYGVERIVPNRQLITNVEQVPIWGDRGQQETTFMRSLPGDGHPVEVCLVYMQGTTARISGTNTISPGVYRLTIERSVDGHSKRVQQLIKICNSPPYIALLASEEAVLTQSNPDTPIKRMNHQPADYESVP
jgi:hypothetical protein